MTRKLPEGKRKTYLQENVYPAVQHLPAAIGRVLALLAELGEMGGFVELDDTAE